MRINNWKKKKAEKIAEAPPKVDKNRNLRPTVKRQFNMPDHRSPEKGPFDADGRLWHGSFRVADKAARKRANKASWAKAKADERRVFLRVQRAKAVLAEAGA